jgi:hypothetical protein
MNTVPNPVPVRPWSASGDSAGGPRGQWVQDAIDVAVLAAVLLLVALIAVL